MTPSPGADFSSPTLVLRVECSWCQMEYVASDPADLPRVCQCRRKLPILIPGGPAHLLAAPHLEALGPEFEEEIRLRRFEEWLCRKLDVAAMVHDEQLGREEDRALFRALTKEASMETTTKVPVKSGIKTTEFWLTLIATGLGAALSTGLLGETGPAAEITGAVLAGLATLGYGYGRAQVKAAGSEDPRRQKRGPIGG